jgi:hypothetical protein
MALDVGDQMRVTVRAHDLWTDTGLDVVDGAVYECSARGHWWDLFLRSDADGYDTPWWNPTQLLTEGRRRVPDARWFALCGAVDRDETRAFVIGTRVQLRLAAGRLMCFANDIRGFYWNNHGAVELEIRRTA